MLDDQTYRWQDHACERQHARLLRRVQALAHILTLAVYVSRQGAVGRGLVLHAARALRQVAAVSCSAPSAGGPKCSRAGQAAAAGSRVLLLVRVCQVVRVSSSSLLCVRSCVFPVFFPVCEVVSRRVRCNVVLLLLCRVGCLRHKWLMPPCGTGMRGGTRCSHVGARQRLRGRRSRLHHGDELEDG
jgi:hypothetical protein